MLVDLKCETCERIFQKEQKEITRQLKKGRKHFFCGLSCSAIYREEEKQEIIFKICPECNTEFYIENIKKKDRTYCSRQCASFASITDTRRNASIKSGKQQSILHPVNSIQNIAKGLKTREGWKYNLIQQYLKENNILHEFEYIIDNSIFDLVLFDSKILIEFDGPYHEYLNDNFKNELAQQNGFTLHRIKTLPDEELEIKLIQHLVQ